jgi:hypothetical protein
MEQTARFRPAGGQMNADRVLALGAAAGPVLFTCAWLVLGFVSPGYTAWGAYIPYSAVHQGVSGLGLGPTAPYMNAAFILNGVLSLVGVVAIFRTAPDLSPRARWTCTVLLAVPAVGSLIDGVFNLESFMLHNLGFALVLSVAFWFPITGVLLRRIPRWRRLSAGLIAAGPITVALAVLFFLTFTPTIDGSRTGLAGLTERLLILEIQAWYVALAWLAFTTKQGASR